MCWVDLTLVAIVAVQCRIRMVSRPELTSLLLVVVTRLNPPVVNVAVRSVMVASLLRPILHVALGPVVRHAIAIVAASAVSRESLWSADIVVPYRPNKVSLGHSYDKLIALSH